jgi:hypothetical protein
MDSPSVGLSRLDIRGFGANNCWRIYIPISQQQLRILRSVKKTETSPEQPTKYSSILYIWGPSDPLPTLTPRRRDCRIHVHVTS